MTQITGEVLMLTWNGLHHPVGATVLAIENRKVIGRGTVDEDYRFEIAIADDVRGEVELQLAMVDAAPSLVQVDGTDVEAVIMWNPINNAYA